MIKDFLPGVAIALTVALLAACGGTPYTPVSNRAATVDTTDFEKKVDTFAVLLDTSGSMSDDAEGKPKIHVAEDVVASFNSAVPPLDFNAMMLTFGKGVHACSGYGAVSNIYGPATYNANEFGTALSSIKCAASTTPITDAVTTTSGLLVEDTGNIAVIIVSDFNWDEADSAMAALKDLQAQHGERLCVHAIKIGDNPETAALASSVGSMTSCGSSMTGAQLASASAMTTYVADTLMAPVPKIEYEKHTISTTALFDFDKAVVKEQGKEALQAVATKISSQGMTVGDIDVIGYTDSIGSADYNVGLSLRRATAVAEYLVSQGVSADLIDVSGMGEADPVASNDTAEGRAQNRRVEVHVGTTRPAQ